MRMRFFKAAIVEGIIIMRRIEDKFNDLAQGIVFVFQNNVKTIGNSRLRH